MKDRILLIEDEELIGEMIRLNLEQEGYTVTWDMDGERALEQARQSPVDLIVLDVMLPGKNGFEIASELRSNDVGTPILMLTARSETASKVKGFDAGADDYLTKPFELDEFLARVRALIRRSQHRLELHSSLTVRFGKATIQIEKRTAETDEGLSTLSQKEADLIALFVKNPGVTLSRADILDEVWGMDATPTPRTVDNYIVSLRKRFEENPNRPVFLHTVRSGGYRFDP